jgi:hypothetical protein
VNNNFMKYHGYGIAQNSHPNLPYSHSCKFLNLKGRFLNPSTTKHIDENYNPFTTYTSLSDQGKAR